MKIEPIDERLRNALCHVRGFAQHMLQDLENLASKQEFLETEDIPALYGHMDNLKESLELVSEYISCFGADGRVSQRGQIPTAWNPTTIFESQEDYTMTETEEVSPEQKDANAKKLLEEIT